jgi:hypothetical protein
LSANAEATRTIDFWVVTTSGTPPARSTSCLRWRQDLVIYDGQFAPTFLKLEKTSYIPLESVYALIEVKPVNLPGYYAGWVKPGEVHSAQQVQRWAAGLKAASHVRGLIVAPGEFGTISGGTWTARSKRDPCGSCVSYEWVEAAVWVNVSQDHGDVESRRST